jgi:hypothetical protein
MTQVHRNGRRPHLSPRSVGSFGVQDAEYGRLEQRVYGIEQGVAQLIQQIERDRSEMAAQMGQDRAHFDTRFSSLQETMTERSRTPWGILISGLSLIVTMMIALGTLAYMPIKAQIEDTKIEVGRLAGLVVPRVEHEREWSRSEKVVNTILDQIHRNQAAIVPRGEHEEKWRGQASRDADLQRQVDDLRRTLGDTYSLKDALRAMQGRLDRIETRGRS